MSTVRPSSLFKNVCVVITLGAWGPTGATGQMQTVVAENETTPCEGPRGK